MSSVKPGVLMVTGAYYPELSGGGLPCREIVRRLHDRAEFTVLTTTADPSLPEEDEQDGVPVHRVRVDPKRMWSKMHATLLLSRAFWRIHRRFSIVHLHGFSQKTILMVGLAHLLRKQIVITLTSVGHDDPLSMRRRGALAFWSYSRANVFAGVSQRFGTLYEASSLPPSKFRLIPNSVDTDRFCAVDVETRRSRRRALGLPVDGPVILFVGFFSREKGPHRLFEAFVRTSAEFPDARLVFIGATRPTYYEIDVTLAEEIRRRAVELHLEPRVIFIESTLEIQTYYQAADLFVLTSTREGLPVALLEAMSSGLGCIATRLEGITDTLIVDGVSGRLIAPGDAAALEETLRFMLAHPAEAKEMGRRARAVVVEGYGVHRMVEAYLETYRALLQGRPAYA